MCQMINIAIDGPSGAGKSSIAKKVSERLGFLYIDTGAMFRSLAYKALTLGIDIPNEHSRLQEMLSQTHLTIERIDGSQHMILDGCDITDKIRTPEVSKAASDIAVIDFIRTWLLNLERSLAKQNNCIMDGRDIGTHVLPDAKVKIFLTASAEVRAERRLKELKEKGIETTFNEVLAEMKYRDKQDSEREIAPLKKADDAHLADTSDKNFEESVELILDIIKMEIK
ncbi:MAG: (d)CMP kinase [Clostridia bacterium]|nr:(d)CMP kinase [Clostridia bacterium]